MRKNIKKLFYPGLLVLLTLVVLIPLFSKQLLYTDDGELHAARIANYYLALKQGQFPPRLAPNLDSGYGSPVLNFAYPLPYLVSTFVYIALPISIVSAFNLSIILLTLTGTLGIYYFARQFSLSPKKSLLISILYLSTPYTLINIFFRSAFGEVAFFAVIPWVLWSFEAFIRSKKTTYLNSFCLILSLTLLLLSHQTSIITVLPILVGYYLFRVNNKKEIIALIKKIIPCGLTAFLLTTWYWLPALWEKQYVILDRQGTITNYLTQFPRHWSFFFQKINNLDRLNTFKMTSVGYSSWVIFLGGLFFIKDKKIISYLISVIAVIAILMMPFTRPLWLISGLGNYIQYPWRLLSLLTLSEILLFIHLLSIEKIKKNNWLLKILFVTSCLSLVTYAQPRGFQNWSDYELFEYFKTTTTFNEFQPIWAAEYTAHFPNQKLSFRTPGESFFLDEKEQPVPDVQVNIESWNGSEMNYEIKTQTSTDVIQKTYYFPGWKLMIDGEVKPINYQDEEFPGHITYVLDPGEHQINLNFTQHTPARIIGFTASILGLISLLLHFSLSKILKLLHLV